MIVDAARQAHIERLVEQLRKLEARLQEGGGTERAARQRRAGKMTARERVAALLDPGAFFLEIGLLIAYDRYDGQAPAAGVVTGLGNIEGRPAIIVANDATVKAGSWWPETITKILRAQEVSMRNRLPIVYLVDSAGVNRIKIAIPRCDAAACPEARHKGRIASPGSGPPHCSSADGASGRTHV